MPPKISLLKLTSPQVLLDLYETKHVVQDMLVPISCLKQSIEFFDEQIEVSLTSSSLSQTIAQYFTVDLLHLLPCRPTKG